MKNSSSDDAKVTWMLKEDSIHVNPLYLSNAKSVEFHLPSDGPGNNIRMSYGIGKWNIHEIADLSDDLDSLVIKWNKGEIRLGTQDSIQNFLTPRRKGFGKSRIEIHIKD